MNGQQNTVLTGENHLDRVVSPRNEIDALFGRNKFPEVFSYARDAVSSNAPEPIDLGLGHPGLPSLGGLILKKIGVTDEQSPQNTPKHQTHGAFPSPIARERGTQSVIKNHKESQSDGGTTGHVETRIKKGEMMNFTECLLWNFEAGEWSHISTPLASFLSAMGGIHEQ